MWEQRPDDWPDGYPWGVDVDLHDFTERRWLTPAHQAALDAGTLNVPERFNDHPSVLVSIPYMAAGTPVAWIDREVAEVVYHAARLGAPTYESCENAGEGIGAYGWRDTPYLWFENRSTFRRFMSLIRPLDKSRWTVHRGERYDDGTRLWAIAIPASELPQVVALLRCY